MARAYVEGGLSYAQIGEEYGITRQRVGQLLGPLDLAEDRTGSKAKKVAREQSLRAVYEEVQAGETTLELAADRLGYSSGHSLRGALYGLGLLVRRERDIPAHGTLARYRSRTHACRCDECRRANREKVRELNGQEPPNHGTYSGYVNYACRCKRCKEAYRKTMRGRRAAKRRKKVSA
jgi:hypothetical protein